MLEALVSVLPLLFLVAIALLSFRWALGRSLGGRGQVTLLREALATGVPPDGTDRTQWIDYLERQPGRHRSGVAVGVMVMLVIALTTVPGYLDADSVKDALVMAGLTVVSLALVGVLALALWRSAPGRNGAQRERLLAALRDGADDV